MPAAYSEPQSSVGAVTRALTYLSAVGKQGGGGTANLVSTHSAANVGDITPGASATLVASVAGVSVPNGAKVIIHCSVQHDVNPPGFGGVDGTAVLFARYNTGGPETVVDSKQEDLVAQGEGITGHNMLSLTTETPPLPGGTYTFDVASSYTDGAASDIPVGVGRITILVVTV